MFNNKCIFAWAGLYNLSFEKLNLIKLFIRKNFFLNNYSITSTYLSTFWEMLSLKRKSYFQSIWYRNKTHPIGQVQLMMHRIPKKHSPLYWGYLYTNGLQDLLVHSAWWLRAWLASLKLIYVLPEASGPEEFPRWLIDEESCIIEFVWKLANVCRHFPREFFDWNW